MTKIEALIQKASSEITAVFAAAISDATQRHQRGTAAAPTIEPAARASRTGKPKRRGGGPRAPISDAVRAAIIEDVRDRGLSRVEAAIKNNVSYGGVYATCLRAGIKPGVAKQGDSREAKTERRRRSNTWMSHPMMPAAVEMVRSGESIGAASRLHGIPKKSVSYACRKDGVVSQHVAAVDAVGSE